MDRRATPMLGHRRMLPRYCKNGTSSFGHEYTNRLGPGGHMCPSQTAPRSDEHLVTSDEQTRSSRSRREQSGTLGPVRSTAGRSPRAPTKPILRDPASFTKATGSQQHDRRVRIWINVRQRSPNSHQHTRQKNKSHRDFNQRGVLASSTTAGKRPPSLARAHTLRSSKFEEATG